MFYKSTGHNGWHLRRNRSRDSLIISVGKIKIANHEHPRDVFLLILYHQTEIISIEICGCN